MQNVNEIIDEIKFLFKSNYYQTLIDMSKIILEDKNLLDDDSVFDIAFYVGHAHKNLSQYNEAVNQFSFLIERFPKKYQGIEGLINVSQRQKDWHKVIERSKIFQNKFPDLWYSYWWLGQAYKNIAEYKEAVNQFNFLIEKFPKKHQGFEGLVNVSQSQKHWVKVIERAQIFQNKFPNLWHSYWWLGQAHKNLAQYKEAEMQFNILIETFPKRHQGITGLVGVYQSKKNWKKVFELSQRLITLYPDLWMGYWYSGEACFNMSRYEEALKYLQEVQTKAPNHILGINFYVNTLSKLDRFEEAKIYLESKIKDFPNVRSLKDNYVKLCSDKIKVYERNDFSPFSEPFFIEGSYDIGKDKVIEKPILKTFWWDVKPNFGDWIGPLLIKNIFDIDCINMRNKKSENVLYTVGSVVQMTEYQPHNDIKVWGSGLIRPLDMTKPSKIFDKLDATSILSLRGLLTHKELSKHMDIDEKKISFGDPALLLPRIYQPDFSSKADKDICIVPHYVHKYYFLSQKNIMDNFNIVDVQTTPHNVIDQITSSKICISSSLHGIIIAQAYGIPWIWLKIEDDLLTRDQHQDFKFFDFFSVMDFPEKFNKLSIYTKDINVENINIAVKEAKVMEMTNNFNGLVDDLSNFIYS